MSTTPAERTVAERTMAALEALAASLSVKVCYEPMAGRVAGAGGLCRLRGEYRIIIDRRLSPRERSQILAQALTRFEDPGPEVLEDEEIRQLVWPPRAQAS